MHPQLDMTVARQHIADMHQEAARIRLARHAADTAPRSQRPRKLWAAMLGAAAIAYALCYLLLERSRFGFQVKALRDNEIAARAQGINTTMVKIWAFVLSAMIPAVLGGINAYWITFINPASVLNTLITDQLVVMVLVGGLGHIWGPALGAGPLHDVQLNKREGACATSCRPCRPCRACRPRRPSRGSRRRWPRS